MRIYLIVQIYMFHATQILIDIDVPSGFVDSYGLIPAEDGRMHISWYIFLMRGISIPRRWRNKHPRWHRSLITARQLPVDVVHLPSKIAQCVFYHL